MRRRIGSILSLRLLVIIEASLVGLFFIQALRFLIGMIYARVASASLYPALNPALIDPNMPGLISPQTASSELSFLVYILVLPLITLVAGKFRWLLIAAAIIAAVGRYLMIADNTFSPVISAALVLGGGLLYIALIVRHRAAVLPSMFILALALDQLLRAFGNTLDPSWSHAYVNSQTILSIAVVALSVLTFLNHQEDEGTVSVNFGLMPIWGGIGFGAMLFLELSLLALPNAVAGRANTNYLLIVPSLMAATVLPLIPWIRAQARNFISLFDSGVRGWSWMLLTMLTLIIGTRLEGIIAGVALVMAQFSISMMWWWLIRPQAQKERNFSGLWIVLGMLIFTLLLVFDIFTYEYAFVRDFAPEFNFLNDIIPPLLRGFRGLGLAVILLSAFLVAIPMVQTRRRIAWAGAAPWESAFGLLLTIGLAVGASYAATPPVVQGVTNPPDIRVATYNIHAGFNEFYDYDLEALALNIQQSGSNVVLLQEIEAGRMTSFGVDQPLWLARRLGMDVRFLPTNEGLQGLAVLSNIEIVFDDGTILDSIGSQTGLQRVQVRPDAGVITVYNTWLDPLLEVSGLTIPDLESSQRTQLTQIINIICAQHAPDCRLGRTVIGGTFNNLPDSDLIQQLRDDGFIDYFEGDPLDRAATFWRTDARARLDYLWTTGNLRVIGRGVSDSRASDHRLATIAIQLQ